MGDEPHDAEIDVVFVGQTGVGKSSLINMIMGETRAEVSGDAPACTKHTTPYPMSLEDLSCQLWDTCGLNEAAAVQGIITWFKSIFPRQAAKQARELKETLRGLATPILVWCIDATKVGVDFHWEQFQKVYVDYCDRKATPVVVITRGPPGAGWETVCDGQLQRLNLGKVPIGMVGRYRSTTSPEYKADSVELRKFLCGIIRR